ncbi:MAG: arylesterase [Desulfovibrionaceae bacterium]|nr:arylesterase [Desulfovibrionaceae bacterium]MBF0514574.1 arylesterase [Desulfovibrionaceae bacterium]
MDALYHGPVINGSGKCLHFRAPGHKRQALRRAAAAFAALALGTLVSPAPCAAGPDPGREIHLTAFGDSLTAGFGLRADQAFPACLERLLRAKGFAVSVDNAGVSGDTTAGGLERLDWSIPGTPDGVILELGANDGLRGLPTDMIEANLEAIIDRLAARGAPVMLVGMKAIMNMGPDYGREFAALFSRLAQKHGMVFYPFFLEGVADAPGLNQSDGLHPNAAGTEEVARRVLPSVLEFLRRIAARRGA